MKTEVIHRVGVAKGLASVLRGPAHRLPRARGCASVLLRPNGHVVVRAVEDVGKDYDGIWWTRFDADAFRKELAEGGGAKRK